MPKSTAPPVTDSPAPPKVKETPTPNAFYDRIGIRSADLKSKFETKKPSDRIKALLNLIQSRIEETRRRNIQESATWAAVDQAVDTALHSTTPTLLNHILGGALKSQKEIEISLKQWGISEDEVFETITEKKQQVKVLKQRTFHTIKLPLAASILKSRVAKLVSERDTVPWLPYDPLVFTEANRLKCELRTNLTERWVEQFAIKEMYRQAQLQAGKYSRVIAFIQESWYAQTEYDSKGKKRTVKEGLRYHTPPIYRVGWDLAHPLYTLNTDTGCEWAMYWGVTRAGNVMHKPDYWNLDQISFGTNYFDANAFPGSERFFKDIYPCQINLPICSTWNKSSNDREKTAQYYQTNEHDASMFLSHMVCKLVPAQWDLGEYKGALWFRFVVANDNTVVFCEPLPATGALFLGWDVDEAKGQDPSFVLEALAHQDWISNLLSQQRLTAQQNLMKIIWYDTDAGLSPDYLKKSHAESQEFARIIYLPFQSSKFKAIGIDPNKIFQPVTFGYQDMVSLVSCLREYMNIMQMMLGMGANEFGTNAPRVTTAAETQSVAASSGARGQYTGSWADDFLDALKRQYARYSVVFSDDEFVSHVTDASAESLKLLEELGFKVGSTVDRKTEVKGTKDLLDVDDFVSSRSLQNRVNNPQLALAMFQSLQMMIPFIMNGSPETIREVLDLANRAAQMAGVPKDFRGTYHAPEAAKNQGPPEELIQAFLKIYKDTPPDVQRQIEAFLKLQPSQIPTEEQMQQALAAQLAQTGQAIQQGAVQAAVQEIGQGIQPMVQQDKQQQAMLIQLSQALAQNRAEDVKVAQSQAEVIQALAQLRQIVEALAQRQQAAPAAFIPGMQAPMTA